MQFDAARPMTQTQMPIESLQPPLFPVVPAPGAPAAPRATTGSEQAGTITTDQKDAAVAASRTDAEPPVDALEAVQLASEKFEEMQRNGHQLRFERDEHGILRIDVFDGMGEHLRSIPPTEALAIASKEARWLA